MKTVLSLTLGGDMVVEIVEGEATLIDSYILPSWLGIGGVHTETEEGFDSRKMLAALREHVALVAKDMEEETNVAKM
ncbi:MAG TPA: hypothetical protein VK638_58260 [Edaphobacter sp.]|nr:hypothetical protein [Edaphobacter sp.]